MAATVENAELDPRVKRTRQLLKDALEKLLSEKQFEEISVQDIAEAASINRATFYDHYTDKFALLECMVAGQFQELLDKRQIRFDGCDGVIQKIAVGVCSYLDERACFACNRDSGQLLETAIAGVVRRMILEGIERHGAPSSVAPEVLASTVAWAIYGAAKEWARMPKRTPVEQISETIDALVAPIFAAAAKEKAD
jgi:AcrR family transcriptional regulator